MADYKQMYIKMIRASEEAINILTAAQRECEDLFISSPEIQIKILPTEKEKNEKEKERE